MSTYDDHLLPNELLQEIKKYDPTGRGNFPPKVAKMIPSKFIEYKKGQSIKFRFPILEKYNNPFDITFGGVFGMFFDSVFGPFSGLESSGPTSSLDLNITYIKSLSIADQYVDVTATINASSKSFFIVEGKMHNKDGKLMATATSRMMILDYKRIKSIKGDQNP